ncbi:Tfp pilus assembly protein FimT/FimU [Altericista sp. CCNU0014]|uniref:pilus assembly FimT family protein n=1 Tax=Altericista sp. CCNU0014 TaxID=3082949 RepID=UPI00384A7EA2
MFYDRRLSQLGFTLAETLVAIAVLGILTAIAAPAIRFGTDPLKDASANIAGNLKLLRAKAVSQTSAYRMRPVATAVGISLAVESAESCSSPVTAWSPDPGFALEDTALDTSTSAVGQRKGVQIAQVLIDSVVPSPSDNWNICYNSRGLTNQTLELTLKNDRNAKRKITVFRGGGVDVKVLP